MANNDWKLATISIDGKKFRHRFVGDNLEIQEHERDESVFLPVIDELKAYPQDTATAVAVIDNALLDGEPILLGLLQRQ